MLRVLFVCHANLCRSPMAEAILADLVRASGLEDRIEVDSAGTSPHHEGQPYHPETVRICGKHGIPVNGASRPLEYSDLQNFDFIIAMDETNYSDILSLDQSGKHRGKVHKLREFNGEGFSDQMNVPDPVAGGAKEFEQTFRIVMDAVTNLFERLKENRQKISGF